MLFLLDVFSDTYNGILAVVNFVCFAAVILCCVFIYIAGVVGQFERYYKHLAVSAIIGLITLFLIHFYMVENLGIPLILPPVGTPYFTEFMHIMQYLASVAVIILGAFLSVMMVLKYIDRYYSRSFMNALLFLIVIVVIHIYLEDTFGVKLIFPPNLWS